MILDPKPLSFRLQHHARSWCLQSGAPKHARRWLTTPSDTNSLPATTSSKVPYPKFPTASLSYHWDTTPPTSDQLSYAGKFFKKNRPTFLWSAPKFKTMDFGGSPEVCFLGRSNVGKSSLLNTLLCKNIAHASSKPGRTKYMNAFAVGGLEPDGSDRLVVLDMPGYGKGGRAEWGKEVLKYLGKRRQLKRAFLLIDAEHGIKVSDRQLLALFEEQQVPYQVILSKADRVILPGNRRPSPAALESRISELRRTMETVKDAIQPSPEHGAYGVGEVIACSSEKWVEGQRMGIDAVRHAVLQAAGMEFQRRITLGKPVDIIPHEDVFGASR